MTEETGKVGEVQVAACLIRGLRQLADNSKPPFIHSFPHKYLFKVQGSALDVEAIAVNKTGKDPCSRGV